MKKLKLYNIHTQYGAKMVDFHGFYMPIQYTGIREETDAVRNRVGVFDVSHMGQIYISGKESKKFLQHLTSNNVDLLINGKVQYTCLLNIDGGIIDDLLLYKFSDDSYMMVVNASNIDKDYDWLQSFNNFDVTIKNKSDDMSLLAVQGPLSLELIKKLTIDDISQLKYYSFIKSTIAGIDNVIISRTGYTGELGFELYVKNSDIVPLWKAIFASNISPLPIGLAARDALRLEKGYCLYGNDINEDTNTFEAGLSWITDINKQSIFSDNLSENKKNINRKLVGIQLTEKGIARKGYEVYNLNENKIGNVTSGSISPTLNVPISLGYISKENTTLGTIILIKIRKKFIKAKVVSIPFVK
ncbi:MAG: glycine cleavage system protein T [Flavobacteriales bacterium]|nr:glycine cleavage system protein T [Flavobacteriales bacterium]|tara:strand:+ start:100 stop:1170 length:1071 start_codon:yes stop_codon:yes gene_type:complete